ncbi:MAG: PilZ domain-containing protein [Bacillota bacterium]
MTQIPEDLFGQITGLTSVHFEPRPRNKRTGVRVALPLLAHAIPVAHGLPAPSIHARVRDISSTGISILCHHPMRTGDSFLICLSRKDQTPIWAVCQVTRCRSTGDGIYLIGAGFLGFKQHQPSQETTPSTDLPLTASDL